VNLCIKYSAKSILLLLLSFFVFTFSYSQAIDSLKNVLKSAKEDTAKVNTISALVWELQKLDKFDESLPYIKEGIALGDKLNHNREVASLYRRSGDYYNYTGDYVEAMHEYTKSLDIETLASRKAKMAICYDKIAKLLVTTKQFPKAISNFNDALKLSEFLGDTLRAVDDCISLWKIYYKKLNDTKNAALYLIKAHAIADSCTNDSLRASLFYKLGSFYSKEGDYEKASEYLNKAIHLHEERKDRQQLAADYYDLGNLYENTGNYQKALEYYLKILKIRETIGTKHEQALANNNAGWGYQLTGDFAKALELQLKSYKLYLETGDDMNIAYPLGNLGIIYNQLGAYEKAIEYSTKAMNLFEKNKDLGGVAEGYNNIGNAYLNMEKYDEAIKNLQKGLEIAKNEDAEYEIKNSYSGLASAYEKKGDYKKAFEFFRMFSQILESIKNQENTERISRMNFSIENEKNQKAIELLNKDAQLRKTEMQKQRTLMYAAIVGIILTLLLMFFAVLGYYHKRKSNKQLSKYNAEILSHKNEIEKLSIAASETDNAVLITDANGNIEWANSAFTRLTGYYLEEFKTLFGENIMAASHSPLIKEKVEECISKCRSVVYESINKTKSGKDIWVQTTLTPILNADGGVRNMVAIDTDITELKRIDMEIKKQNEIITEKNKHITDSINYAKHIQEAILPSGEIVNNILPNSFVLFKPKDIVSGDFYWMVEKGDKLFFAVVDCTGHGVPGAFVSIVGNNGLYRTVNEFGLEKPSEILDKLNELVEETFRQSITKQIKDGMDIALCCYDRKNKTLEFAGANNPLYYIRNGVLTEVKGDKQPIGAFENRKKFTNNSIELNEDDLIYIFSDGYADQFGGVSRKKFKYNQFKNMLLSIHDKLMEEQKDILNKTILTWMGDLEQVDDICVIGVRI